MTPQSKLGGEALVANLTNKGEVAIVTVHVASELTWCQEACSTFDAHMTENLERESTLDTGAPTSSERYCALVLLRGVEEEIGGVGRDLSRDDVGVKSM
ncbi:unnamed protein product [Rodentolepis nana]|uniref:Nudix hydrolase domain-containing protein n=1 Tax=Rodentolepis nana TaxID=102285 RepID=A0A0R3TQW6_RODNA|nr:unnamed protein product [Rodentolepis nana]